MSIATEVLTSYFDAHKALVEAEAVNDTNAIVSLPLHFSAYTRVEISVTQITKDQYVLSDMARTIGELIDAGHSVTSKLRQRILDMVQVSRVEISGNTLYRNCTRKELGNAIHEFGEAAKTIGDAYLVYPRHSGITKIEDDLKERVRQTFQGKQYLYQEKQSVAGIVEDHKVDFLIHPNGARGLALAVLPDPDRLHAEAWGFKTQDIKNRNKGRIIVGVLYNDAKAKEVSRNIIDKMADLAIASTDLDSFGETLDTLGISRGHA